MFEILAFAMMVQAAPVAEEPKAEPAANKVVCKSQKFVGTNIRERICKKQSEWDQGKMNAQRVMEKREMHRYVKGVGGG